MEDTPRRCTFGTSFKKELVDRIITPKVPTGLASFYLKRESLEVSDRAQKKCWPASSNGRPCRILPGLLDGFITREGWPPLLLMITELDSAVAFRGAMRSQPGAVVNYSDLSWQRSRQAKIKPGPPSLRHPCRISNSNWETLFEQVEFDGVEGFRPQCWVHMATNRILWAKILGAVLFAVAAGFISVYYLRVERRWLSAETDKTRCRCGHGVGAGD